MTYKINYKELLSMPACRTDLEINNSRCAIGKILYKCLGESLRDEENNYYKESSVIIYSQFMDSLGLDNFCKIIYLNDSIQGNFQENHKKALELAIELGVQSGFLELEIDNEEKEFNQFLINESQETLV